MGRCGEAGDEIGSRIIAVRIIQSIMNLLFLMEREYIPYSKWYGKAFGHLKSSKEIQPIINEILDAKKWKERELALLKAYEVIGKQHNKIKITETIPVKISNFFDRPYKVMHANRYVYAIRSKIEDQELLKIKSDIGSVNQITRTVDILEDNQLLRRMGELYKFSRPK